MVEDAIMEMYDIWGCLKKRDLAITCFIGRLRLSSADLDNFLGGSRILR